MTHHQIHTRVLPVVCCRLHTILSRLVGFLKNEKLKFSHGCADWSELSLLDNVRQLKLKVCAQQMVREHISFGFF